MAGDYGLSAMTGVLPVVVVAGAATGMVSQMFPGQRRVRSKRRQRQSSVFGPPPRTRSRRRARSGNVFDVIF